MYSEIYVKPNIKEEFDNKYLSNLKLNKEDFDGKKYIYNGEATEFLYQAELDKTFKSWLFFDFGANFYELDSTDGSFSFYNAEEDWHGDNIQASGALIDLKKAYERCIDYAQDLSQIDTFAQRNFLKALEEEELFDKYDIVVVIHYN